MPVLSHLQEEVEGGIIQGKCYSHNRTASSSENVL